MIDEFNQHYSENYVPGWISCINKSISVWHNKNCPEWMCIPWKPQPFGNEYHRICYDNLKREAPIMFWVKLVEGKDWTQELGYKEFEEKGKTLGLILQKSMNLFNKGKVVKIGSVFLVSEGILAFQEKGVFEQWLVKPRGRWLVLVPGRYIDKYFQEKPIGHCETLE